MAPRKPTGNKETVHADLTDLSSKKHPRTQTFVVVGKNKKASKPETAIRRSIRTQGKMPDAATAGGLQKKPKTFQSQVSFKKSPQKLGPVSMREVYCSPHSDEELVKQIMRACDGSQLSGCGRLVEGSDGGCSENKGFPTRVRGSLDLKLMRLEQKNIERVVPGRIMTVKFFPSVNTRMVAAGNLYGNIGFWSFGSENDSANNRVYLYYPHTRPVSGILIQSFCLSKVVTSSYDGFIRLLDVEKETFGLAYHSKNEIRCIGQQPDDVNNNLYFANDQGEVGVLDDRSGKCSFLDSLHEGKINTIDFSSVAAHMMATSSADGTACIWDIRKFGGSKPKSLKMVKHKKAVHSAYFSPSGSCLATTSFDDKIGVLSRENGKEFMIDHDNKTTRWIPTFRAVWGWDDSYIFVGNKNKGGVDVVYADEKRVVATLQSPLLTAIPCRLDTHPFNVGMLAGATAGGEVYVWNS